MTTAPFVELRFNPTDLRPRDLPAAGAFLGSPADALEAALAVARSRMIEQMREDLRGLPEPTHSQLTRVADLAWRAVFGRFRVISAPVIAETYLRAYRAADAGDVPMSVIYSLADKHVEKIGDYFHETSREALTQGFNTYVNRQLPAKAAADRVLDAYGLTPRQMRAYTSAKQFQTPVETSMPRTVKARIREYIDRSFISRTKKMSQQEEHNITQQAQQYAWMWLQEKNRLPERAEKIWITARDERVCPVCGPLHGRRVKVNERFVTAEGEFWTPGLHPNCRCRVRLIEHRFSKDLYGTALADFNEEHPRGQAGRFSTKTRSRPLPRTQTIDVDEEFAGIIAAQTEVEPDLKVLTEFEQLIAAQPREYSAVKVDATTAPVSLQAPAVTVSPFQVQSKLDFTVDLVLDMRTQTKADTKAKADPKTPTRPVETGYALVTYDQLHEGRLDRINLNHGISFDTNDIEAAQKAVAKMEKRVKKETARLKQDPRIRMHDAQGNLYYADVSPKVIDEVVSWTAKQHTGSRSWDPHTLEPEPEPEALIAWHRATSASDEGGGIAPMSFHDVGKQLGIDRDRFKFYMVHLDEIHDPEYMGEASYEQIAGSPRSKEQRYSVDGEYQFLPNEANIAGYGNSPYSVSNYKIVPYRPEENE